VSTPSLITRLTERIRASSIPAARIYGVLFLLTLLYSLAARWIAGILNLVEPYDYYDALSSPISITILVFYYLFDRWIEEAVDDSRSISNLGEEEFTRFKYELVVIPRWPHTLVGLFFGAFAIQAAMAQYGFDKIQPSNLLVLIEWFTVAFITIGFVYRILRLIVLIVQFYSGPIEINLFNLPPLYELSSVVSRGGLFLLLLWYVNLPLNVNEFVLSSPIALFSAAAIALIPFGAFFVPQIVLSRRLNRNKTKLLVDVSLQLQQTFHRLKQAVNIDDLQTADGLRHIVESLLSEKKHIESIPTWPWKLGTFRITVTAVLLPVVVWIIQQVLDRLFAF
jgi:hypothetical protein